MSLQSLVWEKPASEPSNEISVQQKTEVNKRSLPAKQNGIYISQRGHSGPPPPHTALLAAGTETISWVGGRVEKASHALAWWQSDFAIESKID